MKILIIQLARFGDILLTLPAIQSLKRHKPDCQIDVLVRSRFKEAVLGASAVNRVQIFPTEKLIMPFFSEPSGICSSDEKFESSLDSSLVNLQEFLGELRLEGYDCIFNLSYSPLSSYITFAISHGTACVSYGYTRHLDGYLSIPDEVSGYFFSQVGVGMVNRLHLSDLLAMTLGVDLQECDWDSSWDLFRFSPRSESSGVLSLKSKKYVVIHPGASRDFKTLSVRKWRDLVHGLVETKNYLVVLIGTGSEKEKADLIADHLSEDKVLNLVGQTSFRDLFFLLKEAVLFIGGDSAPLHVSSIVQTVTLNFSFSSVNFWETGPKANGSVILPVTSESELPVDFLIATAERMLRREAVRGHHFYLRNRNEFYLGRASYESNLQWELVTWLYFGEPLESKYFLDYDQGKENIRIATLDLIRLLEKVISESDIAKISEIIHSVDVLYDKVADLAPPLRPLIAWFKTEKLRIGPGEFSEVLRATLSVYRGMAEKLGQLNQTLDQEVRGF